VQCTKSNRELCEESHPLLGIRCAS
jgi:hypothetical protein